MDASKRVLTHMRLHDYFLYEALCGIDWPSRSLVWRGDSRGNLVREWEHTEGDTQSPEQR